MQQSASNIDPKYGVAASPRVVESGQPVPKGGGRDMIGQSYAVAGQVYTPREDPNYTATGAASWYGDAFHGRLTANGEIFDKESIAAAHPTLPLPSYVRITNLANARSMIVRINDRGPYHGRRIIDVSERVAEALDFRRLGLGRVKVDYMGRASLRGSDDRKLMATLRADGALASLPRGSLAPIMVANVEQTPRQAAPVVAGLAGTQAASRTQTAASVAASSRTASSEIRGTPVRGVPLPPARPFDLGAGRRAGMPVAAFVPPPRPGRPVVAANLFYVAPDRPGGSFSKATVPGALKPQRFVLLKSSL